MKSEAPLARHDEPDDDLIDIAGLIGVVRRRLWTLIGVSILVFLTVALVTLQMTPRYTATSQVALEMRQSQVMDFEAVLSGLPADSAAVDTEVEILRSRQMASAVVERLNLDTFPEFNSALREPGLLEQVQDFVGSLIEAMTPDQAASTQTEADGNDRVVNKLLGSISIRRAGLTYVLEISATSESPQLAREIANTYADQYLIAQLEAKYEATERANEWLNERVESLREEVRAREDAVARYRDEAGLLDAEGSSLTEQQISDVNAQLVLQRAELAEAEARLRALRMRIDRGASAESIGEVLSSDTIRDLRNRQAEAAQRYSELSSRYGPRHPELQTVEREQADIEAQIDREVQRIVNNLENDVEIARERVRSLTNSLSGLRGELTENYSALVRLRELERDAEASRTLFQSILARFQQTSEQQSLSQSDARIVSEAATPLEPSSPNIPLNLALGLVLGGIAGIGVIALLEVLDNGLHTSQDVEDRLGYAHISSVPQVRGGVLAAFGGKGGFSPSEYLVKKPLSAFAESFRNIRSAIRLNSLDRAVKTVAVTSAVPGEGKTTLSVCLGEVAALAEGSVIVVDCDLRRRLLTTELVPDAQVGLLQVLNGEASLNSAIVVDQRTGLHILPLRETQFTPRDVFGSKAFTNLLADLREYYDLVVLDTAPVLAVADTATIVSQTDAVVFTVRWRKTPIGLVKNALHALEAARARILGVVLNNVDVKAQARYGYGQYGAYQSAYSKYYSK